MKPTLAKCLRLKLNYTQSELSSLLGISKSSIYRYENDTCQILYHYIDKLLKLYLGEDISIEQVLDIVIKKLRLTKKYTPNTINCSKVSNSKISQKRRENRDFEPK